MPDHNRDHRDDDYREDELRNERDIHEDPRRERPMGGDPLHDDPRRDPMDRDRDPMMGRDRDPMLDDSRRDPMMDRDRDPMLDRDRDPMLDPDKSRVGDHPEQRHTKLSDLKGKSILSTTNGERIGQVDDVLVDPQSMSISGLVFNVGGMFDREHHIIPADNVEKWGQDAILIGGGQTYIDKAEVPGYENWISTEDSLHGLSVVTTNGDRLGTISDVMVDSQGNLTSFRVSEGQTAFGGSSFEIPAQATRTLGKDVAIVDYNKQKPR
jgi:uncharacterized protein YrrD